MAGPEARALWAKMKEDPENKICIDCGSNNPQWASVPFGILFCLECSGVHRSLGVHIDFVRSLTMDSWSEKQMNNMKVGGNRNCKDFFRSHKISLNSTIKERYSSHVAEIYKQKIKALSEGQPWTPPAGFNSAPSPSPTTAPIRSLPRQQSTPTTLPNRGRGQPVKKPPKGQTVTPDAWEDEWNDIVVSTPALGQPKYSSPSFVSTSSTLSPNDDFTQSNPRLTNSTSPSFVHSTPSAKPKRPATTSTRSQHHLATDSDPDQRTNDDPDFEKATLHHSSSFNSYLSDSPPKPSYLLPSESCPPSSLSYSSDPPTSSSVNNTSSVPASTLLTTGYELLNKIGSVAYNAASYSTKLATEKIETINTSLASSYATQPTDASTGQGSTWDYVSSYIQTATDTIKQLTVAADPSSDPRQTSYLADTGNTYGSTHEERLTNDTTNFSNGLKSNGRPPAVQIEEDSWFENPKSSFNGPASNNRRVPQKQSAQENSNKSSGWEDWDDWENGQ